MMPVLKEKDQTHYVSDSDMIKFISKNAPMDWNMCSEFVRENNITSSEGNQVYWVKDDMLNDHEEFNEVAKEWVLAFFDAHPWINQMMIVFDD